MTRREPQRARHVALAIDFGKDENSGFHQRTLPSSEPRPGNSRSRYSPKARRRRFQCRLGLGLVGARQFDIEHLALAHAGDNKSLTRPQISSILLWAFVVFFAGIVFFGLPGICRPFPAIEVLRVP